MKAPKTYDEHLGAVLAARAREVGKTQEDVAAAVGLSVRTYGRKIRGETPLTIEEITRIAHYLDESPGALLQRALNNFGGIKKLLSGVPSRKDASGDDAEVLDLLDRRTREESKAVNQQQIAALRGKKGSE